MAIDFELSGLGPSAAEDISLEDIREAAVECGFTKPGVPASKTNAQRANLTTFFKTLGVTSLSGFKKRFHAEKLPCPYPDMTPLIMEKVRRACSRSRHEGGAYLNAASKASRLSELTRFPRRKLQPPTRKKKRTQDKPKVEKITWSVPDVSEYDALVSSWEDKKWRMLPKPGGAVVKPDDWYALHGLQKQVEEGNVKAEKPMWASHGGLDFDGRERWEKWNAAKGLSAEDAKLKFCQAYGKAMSDERNALNFRKY